MNPNTKCSKRSNYEIPFIVTLIVATVRKYFIKA